MRKTVFLAALGAVVSGAAATAEAAPIGAEAVQVNLDHVWTMLAAALVLMMQAGFLLLEAGFCRSKNSINVAQKNIADLVVSVSCFWLIGFAVMFGASQGGLFGWSWELAALDNSEDWSFTFFVFQAVFCGTAATIMSGAVAERFAFGGYILVTLAIALLIYPVFGHLAWGNLLSSDNPAYLADKGFIDFAGSTVVHSIGAWVALAAICVIGPRIGRFDADGRPVEIQGHSPVLSAAGAIILFVGWIGFNGGSTTAGTPDFAHIVAATVVAGVFGGAGALIYGVVFEGMLKPDRAINGLLGGLVAVTAGCDVLTVGSAAIVGLLGGIVALAAHELLTRVFKLDDVVGAVGVHGFAGAFGTIALAFLIADDKLATASRIDQILVQIEGVAIAFVWAFGVTFALLKLAGMAVKLRVSEADEIEGLNRAEHGATLGTGHLQLALAELLRGDADFSTRIDAEPGDEAAELAELFNELLARLQRDADASTARQAVEKQTLETRAEADRAVVAEISALIDQARRGDLSSRLDLTGKVGVLRTVGGGVNELFGTLRGVIDDLHAALEALASGDLTRRIAPDRGGAYAGIARAYNGSVERLTGTVEQILDASRQLDGMSDQLRAASSTMAEASRGQQFGAEQAADELAAAKESVFASVDASKRAETSSQETLALAKAGNEETAATSGRMQRLVDTVRRAQSIVETIESIANQTNMLAINAAVEAARSGPAGRQFSVVAEEVRSLALLVAEASDEISKLMTENTALAEEGAASVDRIRDSLDRIGVGAELVTDSVTAMAARLATDAERIDRVNRTMGDVRGGADRTAQLSADAEATSTRVAESSAALRHVVGAFRTPGSDDAAEAEPVAAGAV